LEDRELVQRLLAKDEKAYEAFYQANRKKLYKVAVYLLGYQDPEAEDVTQEVFLVALKKLPQFEFRSSLYHWLHCICTYLCYERIRNRKRLIASLDEEMEAMTNLISLRNQDHEQDVKERQKMLELVETQKQLMGDPCRNLLDLREKGKKNYAQLSEILKIPIGTVNSRLARCKEALKNLILRALKEASHG
jgi:RNA polymerase sigma-70 factor (ECF subfamily)